ncbi:hypothetical protein SEA_BREYLOR17_39 [Arthrobacter phage Breylor17]|uniref:Uncharacterized protein n=2 Tax=Gordonvirus TaxID=1982152 RepID=A0A345KL82_9CAUD|nr:hypothetical protein QCN34_gp39 [Arthrobacter phage Breylor17]YP_010750400.1 hypothetical protein QCN38_gp39 [Arthrobacter phage Trustiboi]AXH43784.1 hypothetical protein SEA_BREYLOR17_39 [Arthrobacter phage Breylor17]UTN91602.1 hypothetical protein SEA_TRUSTIBOI_39 [Arthrobacter phage Trustiboi]
MFKNRSVQVKLVKDAEDSITNETRHNLIVNEDTAAIAKDIIKHVGVAIVAVSGSIITFKTLSQMAVIKTQAKAYKPMHKL